ncbi:MAG: PQQ-binding-like beta-propeller repeat protein [Thermodesulfobacteriota bacterium]
MRRLIQSLAISLGEIAAGILVLTIFGMNAASAADVAAPSVGNVYQLTVNNFGETGMTGVTVSAAVVQNPHGLVAIREVSPSTADIAAGAAQIFQIRFDVGCPPENSDYVATAGFVFGIRQTTPGPLYIRPCGIDPPDCAELEGGFSVSIKLTPCDRCEDHTIVPKPVPEGNPCVQYICDPDTGNIEEIKKTLPEGDKCVQYICDPGSGAILKIPTFIPKSSSPCTSYTCNSQKGIILVSKPGCKDHPDDNASPNSESVSEGNGPVFDPGAQLGVLTNGFYQESALLSGLIGNGINNVLVDFDPADMERHPVLIIPSGGLYGLDNLPSFKTKLEQYVAAGGTLIVFSQQRGYEYSVLPGRWAGYGWTEDMSCQWKSMNVDTYHPIISGIDKAVCDSVVDGYFTDWPQEATVLLRRAKNGMPCMLLYPYGEGHVIATSMYEDWAFANGQATEDGRRIIRDMLRWALEPAELPEARPGDAMALSVELTNHTDEAVAFVTFSLRNPDNQIVGTEIVGYPFEPGQTVTVPFSIEEVAGDLGIWSVQAELLNTEQLGIQTEETAARFVVGNPPQGIITKPVTVSVNSDSEEYLYGQEADFVISVWNHGETDREFTLQYFFPHNSAVRHDSVYRPAPLSLLVPAGGMQTQPVTVPLFSYDRLYARVYDENHTLMAAGSRGFEVYTDTIRVAVGTDKPRYKNGESVLLKSTYGGQHNWVNPAELRLSVADPQGETFFEQSRPVWISRSAKEEEMELTLGNPAKAGQYTVTAAIYFQGRKIAAGYRTTFDVPKAEMQVFPHAPMILQPEAAAVSFDIHNANAGGIVPGDFGRMTVSLADPNGITLMNETRTFEPQEEQWFSIALPFSIDQVVFGEYALTYQIDLGGRNYTSVKKIDCSASVAGCFDRNEYRGGQSVELTVTAANNGRIALEDMELTLSIPQLSVNDQQTMTLLPGQSRRTAFAFMVPESAVAGVHTAIVSLFINGSSKRTSCDFYVMPAKIDLRFSGDRYQAGETIAVELANSGGTPTTAGYTFTLLDERNHPIAVAEGSQSLPVDGTGRVLVVIPEPAKSGSYSLRAQVTDTAAGETTVYHDRLDISGVEAGLELTPDREVYFRADPKTIRADLTLGQGEIENGALDLEVHAAEKIWTSREDWQTADLHLVDIDSRPGDVLPMDRGGGAVGPEDPDGRIQWFHDSWNRYQAEPVMDSDGTVHAFMGLGEVPAGVLYTVRADGASGWSFLTGGSSCSSPVLGRDGEVYIVCANVVHAVRAGVELWTFESDGETLISPVIGPDGTVHVSSGAGRLLALNPDGTEKWQRCEPSAETPQAPSVGPDGAVYWPVFKDGESQILTMDPDGSEVWRYAPGAWISHPVSVGADGTVYVCTSDGNLHALHPDGALRWKNTIGSLTSRPELGPDGTVYVTAYGNQIISIDPNGAERWAYALDGWITAKPSVGPDGTVYAAVLAQEYGWYYSSIQALNPDGTLHWNYRVPVRGEAGMAVGADGGVVAVDQNGRFYKLGPKGRSVTLKLDAGGRKTWGLLQLLAEEMGAACIQVSTRTADTEGALAKAGWTSYGRESGEGPVVFVSPVTSGPGRWLEIEINFQNAYIGSEDGEYFPMLREVLVGGEGGAGNLVWSQRLPLALFENRHLEIPLEVQLPEGRYILKGALTNSLSQKIAEDSSVFYINDDHIRLIFDADKEIYRSGDTVLISGNVINTLTDPVVGRHLSFEINGALVYSETADLPGLGEHPFAFGVVAPETSFMITGRLDTAELPLQVTVGAPALSVDISPERAGRAPFDLSVALTNQGAVDLRVDVVVAEKAHPLTIPAGQRLVVTEPVNIIADATIPVVITGDVDQTFRHAVDFCEQLAVTVSPAEYYTEGVLVIPYIAENTGCMDSEAEMTFRLNGETLTRTVFAPAGGSIADSLTFNVGAGDYSLTYESVFGSGSIPVSVLGTDRLEVGLDIGYPHSSRVLLLSDSLAATDVETALAKAGKEVTVTRALSTEWDGADPSPRDFDVIVLADSGNDGTAMPPQTQAIVTEFVRNGGGLVITEQVVAENAENGAYAGLAELYLFDPAQYGYARGADGFTKVAVHPVTEGITEPIGFDVIDGNRGALKADATVVMAGTLLPNAVAVKAVELGRIVQFAAADSAGGNLFTDNPAMQTLITNAVHWTARRSAPGKVNVAVMVWNRGANHFAGDLAVTADFLDEAASLSPGVGQGALFEWEVATAELPGGVYPLQALVSRVGVPVQQAEAELEISGPRFEPASYPVMPVYTPGAKGEITFTVRNSGMTQGAAGIHFSMLDILDETGNFWLSPGETETVTYHFEVPDDIAAGDYKAVLNVEGAVTEIPFRIGGLSIDVSALLDQPVYHIGDTAVLTVTVVNPSDAHPEMLARVVSNSGEVVESFILGDSNTMPFHIPVTGAMPEQLTVGLYMASGRSVYINTIPIRLQDGTITLYPDRAVYSPGDTVMMQVLTAENGDLTVAAPGFDETLPVNGDTTFHFVLPDEMVSDRYLVEYQLGGHTGACPVYVNGYDARALEAVFDKEIYEPTDTLALSLAVDISEPLDVIVKGWIYRPDGEYMPLFETDARLAAGDNRMDLPPAGFSTPRAGIHYVVYTIYKADTLLELMSAWEPFEVQPAAVTALAVDRMVYGATEPITARVETIACEPYTGRITLTADGGIVAEQEVTLEGEEIFHFDPGSFPLGRHVLSAQLTGENLFSEKTTAFTVADRMAPGIPAGLAATVTGNVANLTWSPNPEADLVGYHVYRNGVRLNSFPAVRSSYQDDHIPAGIAHSYHVTAVDRAGNESPPSAAVTLMQDSTPPVIAFTPAADTHADHPVTVTYTATDNHDPAPAVTANYPSPTLFYISGDYIVTARATDAAGNTAEKSLRIHIELEGDTDNDGIQDDWEMTHFGALDRDGSGDYDNDGLSDLDEYRNGTDPVQSDAPTLPVILLPADGGEVAELAPEITIENSAGANGAPVHYTFEVYGDEAMTDLVAGQADVPQALPHTVWPVPEPLTDNTWYYWRVRAGDGICATSWVYGRFFVNTENDPPGAFFSSRPADGTAVDTRTPVLEVGNSIDADQDAVTYTFEVYHDAAMTELVVVSPDLPAGTEGVTAWVVDAQLSDNIWYYWRCRATDEHGLAGEWTATFAFFTDSNGTDDPPAITVTEPAAEVSTNAGAFTIKWEDGDPDSNARITLYADTDNTGADGMPIAAGLLEDADGETGDSWNWDISALGDGAYFVYAVITDDATAAPASYAPGALIIDRTPPLVTAAPAGGVYEGVQEISLTADEPSVIYYTLDGSDPTTESIVYSGSFAIEEDTLLKFMAVDPAGNRSLTVTESYTILITNIPPIADAGIGAVIYLGETAHLDGAGSSDPDNGPSALTYHWSFTALPAGSALTAADIAGADTSLASFVPDVIGAYGTALEVYDGKDRHTDSVILTVVADNGLRLSTASLIATEKIHLEAGARINSGHAAVLDQDLWGGKKCFRGEVIVGHNAWMNEGAALYGDTVHIKHGASVDEVYYNQLRNRGTIRGAAVTPLELPLDFALPVFPDPAPGEADITVMPGGELTLTPGAYGEVRLKTRSTLVFTGGVYHLEDLDIGDNNCRVLFGGPTVLIIEGGLSQGRKAYIGPAEGSAIGARDIVMVVHGYKGRKGNTLATAVKIGGQNILKANIFAPDGKIWVQHDSEVEGALIGREILIGVQVQVTLDSGF